MKLLKKICENCGREFYTRDPNKIYCEIRCEDFAKDGIKVESVKIFNNNIRKRDCKICMGCGEKMYRRDCEAYENWEKRKYCSLSCAAFHRKRKKHRFA